MRAGDEQLVQRAQQGDRGAFDEIAGRWERRLYAFVRALTGGSEEAEEVCQDTFAKAWRSLHGFDSQRRLGPWLFKIAANCCRDRWAETPAESLEETGFEPQEKAPSPLAYAVEQERKQAVAGAVESLPANLRRVVELFYLSDFSYAEVADVLGLSRKQVEKRLHRGREVLRLRLQGKIL